MDFWINIDIPSDDEEIIKINNLQSGLGCLPDHILEVRELITRFEVCHFKYRRHYEIILESIKALKPAVEIEKIGLSHPRHAGEAWRSEKTGRSKLGKMYIAALSHWLLEAADFPDEPVNQETGDLMKTVHELLGEKSEKKEDLIRMLISRLKWESVEPYRRGGELSELEYQIEATDICSYSFPENIESLLASIGKLEPLKEFHGCGTYNSEIYSFLSKEFKKLCSWLSSDTSCLDTKLGAKDPIKIWLVASMAKTIKTNLQLQDPIPAI